MYNCARCCPSRAVLLTGLYPHRSHPLPVQRGFNKYYGTIGGGGSYYDPSSLVRDDTVFCSMPDDYYYTDAINDEACRMIQEGDAAEAKVVRAGIGSRWWWWWQWRCCRPEAPILPLRSALRTALDAPPEVIDKYRDTYLRGWDELRRERHTKLKQMGLIAKTWDCSPLDEHSVPEKDVIANDDKQKHWEDARMATYAAQVEVMDRGIGRIVQTLRDVGQFDDTLLLSLSDNGEGGCWPEYFGTLPASDGSWTVVVNDPSHLPRGRDTFMSYGLPWANASNTPFRLFKSWVHEGGVATPFLVHWPTGIRVPGRIYHKPWIIMDIVATCYDVCGINYPQERHGKEVPTIDGESFVPILRNDHQVERQQPLFLEHQGNGAITEGKWKLVNRHGVV